MPKMQDMGAVAHRREVSAGGVVYRRRGNEPEIALASRRTRAGELLWGLPKGRIAEGEGPEEAALREVREESGLIARIDGPLGRISYFYVWDGERISKVVHFFLMRATGGDIAEPDHEMEEVRWFPLCDALDVAAYENERGVIERAAEELR